MTIKKQVGAVILKKTRKGGSPKTRLTVGVAAPLPCRGGVRGWGQYLNLFVRQDITDPTPAPPLHGRGLPADCMQHDIRTESI